MKRRGGGKEGKKEKERNGQSQADIADLVDRHEHFSPVGVQADRQSRGGCS